ncbi:MAG TPA: tRNA (adenosine(37)-N6)-threonylcarbamoyltransferase complex ATPase subunit type 1 TsaE [Pyrinomonadaceae bacterium]|nr:tRNA (adenosine(37)-N6)-threonylcarbamoyltransferase complex ATPase subunit type 1 TsaE [Pyrinomonadaceae bacterium]
MTGNFICNTPEQTFDLGEKFSRDLRGGDVILLAGELGAGKTLFAKGILHGLGYDADEVTSPSFTLVNLYKTNDLDVYHIDLWRLDAMSNASDAVGLDEILEDPKAVAIIEWSDRLASMPAAKRIIEISVSGDGDDPRVIDVSVRDAPDRSGQ